MKTYIALRRIEKGEGEYAEKGDEIQLPDDFAELLLAKGRIAPKPRQYKKRVKAEKKAPPDEVEEKVKE
jgi:hypothetical protein